MQKPDPPAPDDFGVSAADVASIPNFSDSSRALGWICLALIASYELWKALSLTVTDWEQHWAANCLIGAFLAVMLWFPALIGSFLICNVLDHLLAYISPRYARVRKFLSAQKKYQSQLAEYNAWLRRQAESFWKSLDGVSFERELGRLFQRMGFKVTTTRHTGDGGVDLILEMGGQKTVVQCKAHASKVGIGTARELVASMIDFRAHRGILAATSGVTKPVHKYVKNKKIQILDLNEILKLQRAHG
jgi:HJR/Mrr/RecB family endonuclease